MTVSNLLNIIKGLQDSGFIRASTELFSTEFGGYAFEISEKNFDEKLYTLEAEYGFRIHEPRFKGDKYLIEFGE